jgi:hypothetical protein
MLAVIGSSRDRDAQNPKKAKLKIKHFIQKKLFKFKTVNI